MKLQLGHYDDKKEKWQSHEVRFTIQSIHNFMEKISYNGDILDIIGYGETKEEAFENFKTKYRKLLLNFQAFDKELDDITENDIVPVDYRGYMQEESKK